MIEKGAGRIPGLPGLCMLAAVWTAAAYAVRAVRPPAESALPPGGADADRWGLAVHHLLAYVPEETGIVLAGFAAGAVIGLAFEESERLGRRTHLGTIIAALALTAALGPLGASWPALGVLCAAVILWPTCRDPHRAERLIMAVCAAGALIAPALELSGRYRDLAEESVNFGTSLDALTAWGSAAWRADPPWAAESQRRLLTESWDTWWATRRSFLAPETLSALVFRCTSLAAVGLVAGLRASVAGVRHHIWLDRFGPLGAVITFGGAAILLGAMNDWTGLGPRIAEIATAATALFAAWAAVTCTAHAVHRRRTPRKNPGVDTHHTEADSTVGNVLACTTDNVRRWLGTVPGHDPTEARGDRSRPARWALAAALSYTAGVLVVNLTPWTSPTPLSGGAYGGLTGALTALAGLKAAAAAGIAWYVMSRARRPAKTP